MNQPKTSPLFKAVNKNDIAAIKKLLAAGEPVDPQDHERMTPLLRAAEAGNLEVFHFLVNAGANLMAIGMGPTNTLEMAASGGNVEIIRFLIEKGVPLEGNWNPRSPELRRMGHMTPLLCAAIEGKVDAIRVLLEAGADREAKFDKQTALQIVKSEIKFPLYAKNDEEKEHYKAIAVLLAAKESGSKSTEDASTLEVANFATNAGKPACQRLHQLLQDICGKPRRWKPMPDHGLAATEVVQFTLRNCQKEKELNDLFEKARKAKCLLVLAEPWIAGEDASLVLFPTTDKYAAVAATGTEGANYSVDTADIIAWLRDLEQENPFVLRYCNHEMIGGDFPSSVKRVKKVAESMAELCPCALDEEYETVEELAAAIKKHKSFLLRWD